MCGIVGIFNLNKSDTVDENLIRQMMAIIRYRGPDECGLYLDSRIGLGQVRLSIIGLEGGIQPINNEDGNLWIVYNGEAYNYIELKKDLIEKGHRFSTETDTEVVLHLYEEYGPRCLKKINGQVAFAIWDNRKAELFLARDRTGIRPLNYYHSRTRFLFASEIKAILEAPFVERRVNLRAFYDYLTYINTPAPLTIFDGISKLKPGHLMVLKKGKLNIRKYWDLLDYLVPEVFTESRPNYEAVAFAIQEGSPIPIMDGSPASDPLEAARRLFDL